MEKFQEKKIHNTKVPMINIGGGRLGGKGAR